MPPATESGSGYTEPPSIAASRPVSLVGRARSLRVQAGRLDPVLVPYRRRAAELSFEVWLQAIREAPVDVDRFAVVAA